MLLENIHKKYCCRERFPQPPHMELSQSYYLLDTGDFLFMLSPNAAVRLRINNRLHGTVRHDIANPQSLIILHPFLHICTHLRTHIQAPALAGKGDGASLAGSHTQLFPVDWSRRNSIFAHIFKHCNQNLLCLCCFWNQKC